MARVFTKLGKEITMATKGGPDPDPIPACVCSSNMPKENMPKDNVERAIKKQLRRFVRL